MSGPAEIDPRALEALEAAVGPAGIESDPVNLAPHLVEWRGVYEGRAGLMLSPATPQEAAAVLAVCQRYRIGVVPQGGNTGLVGGAVPDSGPGHPQILLSARRLNAIRSVDAANFTITAEAGCNLAAVQDAAAAAGRLFPLSLAAEGSCQLGGNLSTNAGGVNVLRYGMARDLVLGLEVVLPDGRILDALRSVRKDNTGYDLKQLFIGAEGTLGFITAACCKLFPQPGSFATALIGVATPAAAVDIFSAARMRLGDGLVAFELMNRLAMDLVLRHIPGTRDPLDAKAPWYVLVELASQQTGPESDAKLESFLGEALNAGQILDGVLASSDVQRQALWRIRHSISEAQKLDGAGLKHDISVPVSQIGTLLERASAFVTQAVPGAQVVAFGHLGDGNVHFNINQPPGSDARRFLDSRPLVSERIHELADELGGSFSAEHGIGLAKEHELARLRSPVELDLMRALKSALDPAGIMNPGKMLRDETAPD